MEESVQWDAEINTTQEDSFPSYRYPPRHGEFSTLHISAWVHKSPPAEDNQPK